MAGIFISYRRKESAGVSGRIFDRLSQHFGAGAVFMDIDSIPIGQDYREHIDATLQHCDLILAVVGPRWSGPRDDGRRRIDDPTDLVRLELEGGLKRKIPVVPVLIEDAAMPQPEELPESLRSFAYRNSAEIDSGKDFHVHMERLIRAIERIMAPAPATPAAAPAPQPVAERVAPTPEPAPPASASAMAPTALQTSAGSVEVGEQAPPDSAPVVRSAGSTDTVRRWALLAAAVAFAGLIFPFVLSGVRFAVSGPFLLFMIVLFLTAALVPVQISLDERNRSPGGRRSRAAKATLCMLIASMVAQSAAARMATEEQEVALVVGALALVLLLSSIASIVRQRARRTNRQSP